MSQVQVVQLIYIVLPFILTGLIVPLVHIVIQKLPLAQQKNATLIVEKAVNATEQLAASNTANVTSQQKKTLALQLATTLLADAGLKIDPAVVSALIESAVWLLNSQSSALPTPVNVSVAPAPVTVVSQSAPTPAPVESAAPSAQPVNPLTSAQPFAFDISGVSSQTAKVPAVSV